MPSRTLSILAAPAHRIASELVWFANTSQVLGARWGWDWFVQLGRERHSWRHPQGRAWGWMTETTPQPGTVAWSLSLWLGPFLVLLDRKVWTETPAVM